MIKLIRPDAVKSIIETLIYRDLLIDDKGTLFEVSFINSPKSKNAKKGEFSVTAYSMYNHDDGLWYKTNPGTKIENIIAFADNREDAIEFSKHIREYAEQRDQEIERVKTQFFTSARMFADEYVDKIR